jgi:hypothetical protein
LPPACAFFPRHPDAIEYNEVNHVGLGLKFVETVKPHSTILLHIMLRRPATPRELHDG